MAFEVGDPPHINVPLLGSAAGGDHGLRIYSSLIMAFSQSKRPRPGEFDDTLGVNCVNTKVQEQFPRYLIIKSTDEDSPVTNLSPFVIEKQIEALIGTPKNVKKLKNKTLLVETNRKSQTEQLLKTTKFFNLEVTVSEHTTLNTSKGIIKDRMLKEESEENIVEYLKPQGVIGCKRFTIRKALQKIQTNTLLLTFNTPNVPKDLKIFYRMIPVEIYIPNPLRCFCCHRFGHHENNCTAEKICQKCGQSDGHTIDECPNPSKCVNCGKDHSPRSPECEVWKKEKEIMRIKVTRNVSYLEARKLYKPTPEPMYSKIVASTFVKPQMKNVSTQYEEKDFKKVQSSRKPLSQMKETTSQTKTQNKPSSSQSQRSRSNSTHRSPSNSQQKTSSKDQKHSGRPKKGSKDPVQMAKQFTDLETMELEMDPT